MSPSLFVVVFMALIGLSVVLSLGSYWWIRGHQITVPPFRALLVGGTSGPSRLVTGGTATVLPGAWSREIDLTIREMDWSTQPGGEFVLRDGSRLALSLRIWFQVPSRVDYAKRAIEQLGERLDADQTEFLARVLGAPVQTAVADLGRYWDAESLPVTATIKQQLLDRIDKGLEPLGLISSEVEIQRLEIV